MHHRLEELAMPTRQAERDTILSRRLGVRLKGIKLSGKLTVSGIVSLTVSDSFNKNRKFVISGLHLVN